MLLQRVLSAMVLIPVTLAATYYGGIWFFALVAVAALLAGYEYYRLLQRGGYHPSYIAGLFLVLLLLLDALYPSRRIAVGGLALVSMLLMTWQVFRENAPGSLADWALNLAGAVYIGWGAHHFVALRQLERGLYWIILLFAVTWICDSAAYFVGRAIGKRRFFPKISPKKTLEGAIAGVVAGIAASIIVGLLIGLPWPHGLVLGVLASLGSTFGDLGESVIKRQVGVKDSSNLIPGHGGMLDRLDSLLFNVVIVFYYVYWVLGAR